MRAFARPSVGQQTVKNLMDMNAMEPCYHCMITQQTSALAASNHVSNTWGKMIDVKLCQIHISQQKCVGQDLVNKAPLSFNLVTSFWKFLPACIRSQCKPMLTKCVQTATNMNTDGHGMNQSPPICDEEGYFSPMQCYPGGLCRCVDKDTGNPVSISQILTNHLT